MDALLEKVLIPIASQVPALAVVAWIIFKQNQRDIRIAEEQRQVAQSSADATKNMAASYADATKSMAASYTDATKIQTQAMFDGLKTVLDAVTNRHAGGDHE